MIPRTYCLLVICLCLSARLTKSQEVQIPEGFKLGVATSAYQVEGGWDADGKGPSIWDTLTHNNPELISDGLTGDVACDSYHLWEEDVRILADLGVTHYRFSIAWSRLLPSGLSNQVNPAAVEYYNNLINALIENNIEPLVTLYHWDLPEILQELGGWMNPDIQIWYEEYAGVAFREFGDRVKNWLTMNEPVNICVAPYEVDVMAPTGVKVPGIGLYICGKNLIMAHARAYRLYEREFKDEQQGRVGITIDSDWAEPKTDSDEDREAADRHLQLNLGWWAHPIFSAEGNYPQVMRDRIGNNSAAENFAQSRLPPFTDEELEYARGAVDFLGLNYYVAFYASPGGFDINGPPSYYDKDISVALDGLGEDGYWGIRSLLNWIREQYDNPTVIITENGWATQGDTLEDDGRIRYIRGHMREVVAAATEDGCNVEGYTAWGFLDDLEWRNGYTVQMGLYQVDFNDPNRQRTPKKSALWYKDVIANRVIPGDDE